MVSILDFSRYIPIYKVFKICKHKKYFNIESLEKQSSKFTKIRENAG